MVAGAIDGLGSAGGARIDDGLVDGRGSGFRRSSVEFEHCLVATLEAIELVDAHVEQQQRTGQHGTARERPVGDRRSVVPPPADDALAYRGLQVPVRGLGHGDREDHRPDEVRHRAGGGTDDHEDRPAPQVQPVAPLAHLDQRRPAHDAAEPDGGGMDGDHHGDQRQDRHEWEEPLVHVALGEHGDGGRATEHRHRGGTDRVEGAAHRRVRCMLPPPRPPEERRSRSEEEPAGAGDRREVEEVRPVDAHERFGWAAQWRRGARVHPEHVGEHHERCGDDRAADDVTGCSNPQQRHEHQRPDQIPLLLHRQAPQVPQQRRLAGEVRDVAEDLAPVVHVEDRPRDVAAHLRLLFGRAGERGPHGNGEQHGVERREEPTCPAEPELTERHLAVAAVLVEQQRRDQESGDHEEHLDAEEPPVHPREPPVVQQDDADGQRTQPVERRLVAHRGERGRRPDRRCGGDRCRSIDERGHRRSDVPSRVVSTVHPSAWSSARSASAVAKSLAARASSSA